MFNQTSSSTCLIFISVIHLKNWFVLQLAMDVSFPFGLLGSPASLPNALEGHPYLGAGPAVPADFDGSPRFFVAWHDILWCNIYIYGIHLLYMDTWHMTYGYIYIWIYIYIFTCHIWIYIYRERESEREICILYIYNIYDIWHVIYWHDMYPNMQITYHEKLTVCWYFSWWLDNSVENCSQFHKPLIGYCLNSSQRRISHIFCGIHKP